MLYHSIYPQINKLSSTSKNRPSENEEQEIRFPQDIQVIVRSDRASYGNLFIGNIEAAQNVQLIENLEIGAVLSLGKGYEVRHPKEIVRHSCYVPFPQFEQEDCYQELQESVKFIEDSIILTNVLVHCVSGGNKSGCVAMAFLVKNKKLSSQDAEIEVKNRRKMIMISDHMREQLKKYELDLNNTGLRKSKFNYSIRVDTKRSKSEMNRSCFGSELPKSESSIKTHKNQLIVPAEQTRFKQTSQKSNTNFNEYAQNSSLLKKKSKTLNQNPEQPLFTQRQDCKSMQLGFMNNLLNKSGILDRSQTKSRSPSLRKKVPTVTVEPFNTQVYDIDQVLESPKLTKKSNSRQQFEKRINTLDKRNSDLNLKLLEIQGHFEKTNEANKLLLQCEMKEIDSLKDSVIKQHQERQSRIRQRAKQTRQNCEKSSINTESLNISRVSRHSQNNSFRNSRFAPSSRRQSMVSELE